MATIRYDKLVRDRIPQVIRASGQDCTIQVLEEAEYLRQLDAKLEEELGEYLESGSLEELADLLEVLQAVVGARGWTWAQLEEARAQKARERGGFAQRLFLREVTDREGPGEAR